MSTEEINHLKLMFDKLNGINGEQIILKQNTQILNGHDDASVVANDKNMKEKALEEDEQKALTLALETCDSYIFHESEKTDNNKNNTIDIQDKINDNIDIQQTTVNQLLTNFIDERFNTNNYSADQADATSNPVGNNENEFKQFAEDKQTFVINSTLGKCDQTDNGIATSDKIIQIENFNMKTMFETVVNQESTNEIKKQTESTITENKPDIELSLNQMQHIVNDNEIINKDLTPSTDIAFRIVSIKEKQVITRTKVSKLTKFWKDRMVKNLNKI